MRKVARGLALTIVALMALVPIQATPAGAFVGGLDLDFEKVNRITGSIHRVTATLTQVGGVPASVDAQIINFEFSGARAGDSDGGTELFPPDTSCTTKPDGKCSITKTSAVGSEGLLKIRAWHQDASPTDCAPPPFPSTDCDNTEAQDETTVAGAGATAEPDDTDVVEVTWLDGVLEVEEEKSFAPSGPVTFTATVLEKDPAAGAGALPLLANVDAEVEVSTATPTNKDKVPGKADTECPTDPTTGKCDLIYAAGAGSGVDTIRAWVDLNDDPGATTGTPPVPAPTGDETAPGATYEADTGEQQIEGGAGAGTIPEPDITDVVKANISAAQVLTLTTPTSPKAVGTQSNLTVSVTMGSAPQSGIKVAAVVLGGGANAGKTATCTTTANGQCPLNYTGTAAGTDRVQAAVDTDGNGSPNEADQTEDVNTVGGTLEPDSTDVVQVTWESPAPPPPPDEEDKKNQCDATRDGAGENEIVIGTKKNDRLCGFGGNDSLRGLKGNDRLNGGPGKDSAKGGPGTDRCKAEKEAKSCEK